MNVTTPSQLQRVVEDWLREKIPAFTGEIREETDLIASGLLDSLGFIELMVFAEGQTGQKVDLSDIDPSDFTTLGGFCKHIAPNGHMVANV